MFTLWNTIPEAMKRRDIRTHAMTWTNLRIMKEDKEYIL